MKLMIVFFVLAIFSQDVPFKAKDEYALKLDYNFKTKPHDHKSVYEADVKEVSTSPLPHLTVLIEITKITDETKVRIASNKGQPGFLKKANLGAVIQVPFGFTDDVKDGITSNEYTLTFLNKEKKELSRLVLLIDKEGQFFVNGEKQGRF
jgi:hypothetical protein